MPVEAAPIGMHNAEQALEQLALTHALERRYSDNFAWPNTEGKIGYVLCDAETTHLKRWRAGATARRLTACRVDGTEGATYHKPHHLVVAHLVESV
jgi:hypothetical protein